MADEVYERTSLDVEIDRGFSLSRWRELEKVAVRGFNEQMRIGDEARSGSFLRVDFSILDQLGVGDSVFVPARYGVMETRAAAHYRQRKHGWLVVCRKTYEHDRLGIRVFRVS